jgi:hypothetical protein
MTQFGRVATTHSQPVWAESFKVAPLTLRQDLASLFEIRVCTHGPDYRVVYVIEEIFLLRILKLTRVNPRNMSETMHTGAPPSHWLAYSIARGWSRSRPTIASNLATFSHMKGFRSSNNTMFRPPSMRTSNVTSLTFSQASKRSSSTSALTLESSCRGHRKVMASMQTARLSKGLAFSTRKFSEKRSHNFEFCSPPLL